MTCASDDPTASSLPRHDGRTGSATPVAPDAGHPADPGGIRPGIRDGSRPDERSRVGVGRGRNVDPLCRPSAPTTPVHVACIMDGNGRWAGRRGLARTEGHTEGEENLARLVRIAVRRNIGWLTVFGFSTENWIRPRAEVRHILGLHAKLFGRVQELNELNVRIQWIGRPFDTPDARTPQYVQRAIRKAIADTSANTGMLLTVAFDYGARQELIDAVRRTRAEGEEVTTDAIARHLYLPELPPVDVLVRTSGERRVSNFLLWQSAGAAIHFTDKTWPEFDAAELDAALALVP